MRERYLEAFDAIRIDCLNGDKYKTGKTTPDGRSDPSIFSTEHNREGIQVGTAIATLIRKREHTSADVVGFRHLWGAGKWQALVESAEADSAALYAAVTPRLELGLPFVHGAVEAGYLAWPRLPELFPVSFPGVKTSRDDFVVAIDRVTLEERLEAYFDPAVSHAEMRALYPSVMTASARYNSEQTRDTLRRRGGPLKESIVRYAYRPFDIRWLYWEPETDLLDRKREDYWPHGWGGNITIATQKKPRRDWMPPQLVSQLACLDLIDRGASMFPAYLRHEHAERGGEECRPNLTQSAATFLSARGLGVEDLFHHTLAVLHAPAYRRENASALRMDWPRLPVPDDTAAITDSAALGRELAALLDAGSPLPGVTSGALRPELAVLCVPVRNGGGGFGTTDCALTAGWGSLQGSGIVMPGRGTAVEREYRPEERQPLEEAIPFLGETTFDIYLNADAYWANVPAAVWRYTLGGYPVIKKWLSYRERTALGRPLKVEEVIYVSHMVRRIAAILLLAPRLDGNYERAKTHAIVGGGFQGGGV
jgi:hypothetical protein